MTEEVSDKENVQENDSGRDNQLEQRVAELEQAVADKESEVSELKEKLSTVSKSLEEAVTSYKSRVIQLNPSLTGELIEGGTIEAVDKSLEKALNLIGRVKKSVEKEISHTRVPTGAPGRRTPDLSGLSPREKIQYAIGGKK